MRRIPVVKRRRTSSVLKHGAYGMGLLQGEDPAAFEKLHKELVADYSPIGVLAEEVVWTMTRIVWRRRHMDTFGAAQRDWERYDRIESRQRSEMAKGLMVEGLVQSYTVSSELPPEAQKELRNRKLNSLPSDPTRHQHLTIVQRARRRSTDLGRR